MDTTESSAPHAHSSTEDQDHHDQDERPHACNDGWVTIGQLVVDPETGEEREEFAQYLCRKCARSEARAQRVQPGPGYPSGCPGPRL